MAETILIVDDDDGVLTAARLLLKRHVGVATTNQPDRIPSLMAETAFDVVLLDMNFATGERSGREGLSWLSRIRELDPEIVVVLMTAYTAVEIAVEAMKLGAFDFVVKPWHNEKLIATVRAALELRRSRVEAASLRRQNRELVDDTFRSVDLIIGDSPAMRQVYELVAKAAPTEANVLILGENGTGKELIAREIHRRSTRAANVFLSVDVASIPEDLIASELFGHRKGAFTGATEHRVGRFPAAAGGTLFLDEIGNIPRHHQAKLLTALERREVIPVGANAPVSVDVRVISATNTPPADLLEESIFRQDLLYRLNTVEIVLPPLRERKRDIPLLADHFLRIYKRKYDRLLLRIADDALAAIIEYAWPGNVRALRHAIERAVILCDGQTLRLDDFSLPPTTVPESVATDGSTLAALEKQAIAQALARHAGNITYAAAELGITRASLYRRMGKHGL